MSEFKSIDEAMGAAAADAVQLAAEAGVKLDYSLASVEIVEQQLARLHKQISEKSPSDREITVMSYRFGTYIAEVLKRSVGGSWSEQSSLHPGYQLPTFTVGGIQIWPQMKVEKRLRNGPEDNVWHYFLFLLKDLGAAPDLVASVFMPDR